MIMVQCLVIIVANLVLCKLQSFFPKNFGQIREWEELLPLTASNFTRSIRILPIQALALIYMARRLKEASICRQWPPD
jgi:hypothetical protein